MAYTITQRDLSTISDVDVAFSTDRFFPAPADIPADFYRGNAYTDIPDALFAGVTPPAGDIVFNDGIVPDALLRCVMAHLGSFTPRHEDKIAGIGYMISLCCTVTPDDSPANHPTSAA